MTHNTKEVEEQTDIAIANLVFSGLSIAQIEKIPKWLLDNIEKNKPTFKETLHHQLQKTQHDWLRELKAVQRDFIARWEHPDSELPPEHTLKSETLYHLQTIIDRYQAELDQDKLCSKCREAMENGSIVYTEGHCPKHELDQDKK